MLKFLDNRNHQQPRKSPKKYQPQFLYGNSYECPSYFQTNQTIFHKSSYINPHLNYQHQRLTKMPSESLDMVRSSWKKKVDLQSVQEQKIVSSNPDLEDLKQSKYLSSFYNEYDRHQGRFRKIKGQFTSFIEKNNKFKALGPLHGDERDQTRINQTKRSVWLKPKSTHTSGRGSFLNNSDLNISLRSSISKNSQLITQKQRIRQNRQKVYNNYKRSLQKRKHQKANSHLFQLPRAGPQHQLVFFNTKYDGINSYNRYSIYENRIKPTQSQQIFRDLDRFQITMYNKIK